MPARDGTAAMKEASGDVADRTALVAARLKSIYTKHVLPVEKRYQYEYFFESPLLSDVEFDGKSCLAWALTLYSLLDHDTPTHPNLPPLQPNPKSSS